MEVVLPEVKKPKTPEEKVKEALDKATKIYLNTESTSWGCIANWEQSAKANVIEIAKLILQETK